MKLLCSIIFGFALGMVVPGSPSDWSWWYIIIFLSVLFNMIIYDI